MGILTGFLRRQAVLPQRLQPSASPTPRPEQLSKVTQQQQPSFAVDTSPAAPAQQASEQSTEAEVLPRLEQLQQAAQAERQAQLADLERAVQAKRAKLGSEQARCEAHHPTTLRLFPAGETIVSIARVSYIPILLHCT